MNSFNKYLIRSKTQLVLLIVSMCLISCSQDKQDAEQAVVGGTPVQVTHPIMMDFTDTIDLNANTLFLTKEIVRVTFQGFIDKISKNIGDEVKTGDLLFLIKTKESSAEDSLQISLGDELFKGSIAIRAKSAGVLTTLNYNVGDFVSEGEQIAAVSNPSSLCVALNVPYQYAEKINRHKPCELFLPDGRILLAVIQKSIPSVDPISQTQTFLLRLNKRANLPENLNVTVRLPLQTVVNAMGVPSSAVMSDETQENFWIMKLINDSTAVRIGIQKGVEYDSLIQIASPILYPNDQLISDGAFGLPDTAKVTISR